jgi:hypothetical protein
LLEANRNTIENKTKKKQNIAKLLTNYQINRKQHLETNKLETKIDWIKQKIYIQF